MAREYKTFTEGEQLSEFPGVSWNQIVDSAKWVDEHKSNVNNPTMRASGRQALVFQIVNSTDEDIDYQFPILSLENPIVEDDENNVHAPVMLKGVKPSKTRSSFAVLKQPIGKDEAAIGVVKGFTFAKVDIKKAGDRLCGSVPGNTEHLESGHAGATIIWAEHESEEEPDDQIGIQYCLIDVQNPPPIYLLTNCANANETIFVSNDLAGSIDKVVLVNGICFKVSKPPKQSHCWSASCVTILGEYETCEECSPVSQGCWLLTPCVESGPSILLKGAFGIYNGAVVKWEDGKCYKATPFACTPDAIEADISSVQDSYPTCNECNRCIRVRSCRDSSLTKFIPYNTFPDPPLLLNVIVQLDGECFEVISIDSVCETSPYEVVWNEKMYDDCESCGCYEFKYCKPNEEGEHEHFTVTHAMDYYNGNKAFDLSSLKPGDVVSYIDWVERDCAEFIGWTTEGCEDAKEELLIGHVFSGHDSNCFCCMYAWSMAECGYEDDEDRVIYINQGDIDKLCDYYFHGNGKILKRAADAPDDKCYHMLANLPLDFELPEGKEWEEFLIDTEHGTCEHCQHPLYRLTDADCAKEVCKECDDGVLEAPRITDENLYEYTGQIIKYDGVCWKVTEAVDEEVTDPAPIKFRGPFSTCEECLKEPSCIEFITEIDWEKKEVTYTEFALIAIKCNSHVDPIPTAPCPEPPGEQ